MAAELATQAAHTAAGTPAQLAGALGVGVVPHDQDDRLPAAEGRW